MGGLSTVAYVPNVENKVVEHRINVATQMSPRRTCLALYLSATAPQNGTPNTAMPRALLITPIEVLERPAFLIHRTTYG